METSLRKVQTSVLDLAYEERGAESAPAVVLLHGWPDDVRTWDGVAERLSWAGYRVIVPYLRGFGPTRFLSAATMRSGQLSALASDLLELTQALGLERFAVAGHDWGARAAYIAAAEYPERVSHLIAISVGYGTNSPEQTLPLPQARNYWYHWYFSLPRGEQLVRDSRHELARFMWQTWSPEWDFSAEEYDRTALSFDNPDWPEVTIHSYRHRWGLAPGDPRYAGLEERVAEAKPIHVPALVLHGGSDACNDPATSADREEFFSDRYRRKVLPGVGHFPQREAAGEVADEILAWLRDDRDEG